MTSSCACVMWYTMRNVTYRSVDRYGELNNVLRYTPYHSHVSLKPVLTYYELENSVKYQWNIARFVKKIHLKMLSPKWWPFCLSLNIFILRKYEMNEEQIAGFPVIPGEHLAPNSHQAAICARRDQLRWQYDTRGSGFVKGGTLVRPLWVPFLYIL